MNNNEGDLVRARTQHRNLIDAGLHVYAYEGVALTEIVIKTLHFIFLSIVYYLAADVRYK